MKQGSRAIAAAAQNPDSRLVHALAGLAFLAALAPQMPLLAQGLDSSKAISTIIGSDVKTEKESAAADRDRLIAAIDKTPDAVSAVHKSFNLDKVEIVFLPDFPGDDGALKTKYEEHSVDIRELREAIEGNAMFFHAVDSRSVMLSSIVAVSFDGESSARIYAMGEPPSE